MSHHSKIIVQYKNGSKARSAKVTLSFSGLFSGGVTKAVYTDRHGIAIVEHASRGTAKVYVNGRQKGTMNAPGETVVFI